MPDFTCWSTRKSLNPSRLQLHPSVYSTWFVLVSCSCSQGKIYGLGSWSRHPFFLGALRGFAYWILRTKKHRVRKQLHMTCLPAAGIHMAKCEGLLCTQGTWGSKETLQKPRAEKEVVGFWVGRDFAKRSWVGNKGRQATLHFCVFTVQTKTVNLLIFSESEGGLEPPFQKSMASFPTFRVELETQQCFVELCLFL